MRDILLENCIKSSKDKKAWSMSVSFLACCSTKCAHGYTTPDINNKEVSVLQMFVHSSMKECSPLVDRLPTVYIFLCNNTTLLNISSRYIIPLSGVHACISLNLSNTLTLWWFPKRELVCSILYIFGSKYTHLNIFIQTMQVYGCIHAVAVWSQLSCTCLCNSSKFWNGDSYLEY